MSDLIERQAAISLAGDLQIHGDEYHMYNQAINNYCAELIKLPSAQPMLCGYNIEHLILIADVLRKENLPPDRVVEALTDIERIISIVKDEFEESLRKAVEQCKI